MTNVEIETLKNQISQLISFLEDKGQISCFEVMQKMRLTLSQVIRLNWMNELNQIKASLFFYTQNEIDSDYNVPLHVFEIVSQSRKAFSDKEISSYQKLLEKRFYDQVSATLTNNSHGVHDIIEMGIQLISFYGKKGEFTRVDEIFNKVIDTIEFYDDTISGMRMVGIYRDLVLYAKNWGRQGVLERISRILEKNAPDVHKNMAQISNQISIPVEEVEADYNSFTVGFTPYESIGLFALRNIPDDKKIDRYNKILSDAETHLSLFRHLYFDHNGNLTHEVRPDDKEAQENAKYSTLLQYYSVPLHLNIETGIKKGLFDIETVMNYISESKVLNEKRISIIEKGIYAFLNYDYITSISVLVPQIEYMIREMYHSLGHVITENDEIGTLSDALGALLKKEEWKFFDINITKYLKTILADRSGWNVRNSYCHGLTDSFSMIHADRVFHIIVLLATLTRE